MPRTVARLALAGFLLLLPLLAADAQERAGDDYRRLYKEPTTTKEYWAAIKFELDVGQYEMAGKWLRMLVAKKPPDKDLLEITDAEGTLPIYRLRNVRNWTSNDRVIGASLKEAEAAAKEAKAAKDKDALRSAEAFVAQVKLNQATTDAVELLITRTQEAIRKRATDAGYIRNLINQLKATPEERSYAIRELVRLGPSAVPHLLDEHARATEPIDRLVVRQALERMGERAVAPMLAGLDGYPPLTKLEILTLLRTRYPAHGKRMVPFLWYPAANRKEDVAVRRQALKMISDFEEIAPTRLPPAKVALTREAEKYYRREMKFDGPVAVWRWDGKTVVSGLPDKATVTASDAEEYYGLRFARQALELDPDYRPAQVVFLSLALDKEGSRPRPPAPKPPAKPVTGLPPALNEQLNRASLELLLDVLDRALREERLNVILPVVRVLELRAEVRAKKPLSRGEPGLVRALYYRDPRVQLAAARALLAIPGANPPHTHKRILDILGRMLSPAAAYHPGRKVLVAIADEAWRNKAAQAVTDLGGRPVVVTTGRDAMRKLRASADIDLVLLESTLPEPGLAHLLAQMRADVDVGKVPILLAAVPETRAAYEASAKHQELRRLQEALETELRDYRARIRDIDAREEAARREITESLDATSGSRSERYVAMEERFRRQRREVETASPGVLPALRRLAQVEAGIKDAERRYDLEAQVREASLARFVARYSAVTVVHASGFSTTAALADNLKGAPAPKEGPAALNQKDREEMAETAVRILHDLAHDRPAGLDVRPLTNHVLDALKTGRLSLEGQRRAIEIAARLPGARPQQELAAVVLAASRPAEVRLAAAAALQQHRQRYGNQLAFATAEALRAEAGKPGTPADLKERLDLLTATLGDARGTGERLRDYTPTPAAPPAPPVIPPPEK